MVLLDTAQTDVAASWAELGCLAQTRLFVSAEENGDDGDGEEEADDGYYYADYSARTEAVAAGAGVRDGDYGRWGFGEEGGGRHWCWCHCVFLCSIIVVVEFRCALRAKMIEDAKSVCSSGGKER